MIKMRYDPINGEAIRDGDLDAKVSEIIQKGNNNNIPHIFATENIFLAIRLAIKQGKISCRDVEFYFRNGTQDHIFFCDRFGTLDNHIPGFIDETLRLTEKLIDW